MNYPRYTESNYNQTLYWSEFRFGYIKIVNSKKQYTCSVIENESSWNTSISYRRLRRPQVRKLEIRTRINMHKNVVSAVTLNKNHPVYTTIQQSL